MKAWLGRRVWDRAEVETFRTRMRCSVFHWEIDSVAPAPLFALGWWKKRWWHLTSLQLLTRHRTGTNGQTCPRGVPALPHQIHHGRSMAQEENNRQGKDIATATSKKDAGFCRGLMLPRPAPERTGRYQLQRETRWVRWTPIPCRPPKHTHAHTHTHIRPVHNWPVLNCKSRKQCMVKKRLAFG